jgi:fructokinase
MEVVTFGELLIDFIQNGMSSQGNGMFEASPGGAVSNAIAMLNRLGHETAFMGKVGDDIFGHLLKKTLDDLGIDTTYLLFDQEHRTTLAFVANDETGERSFSFYRDGCADTMFRADEMDEAVISQAKLFHFGTLSMTHECIREATKKALRIAKENGVYLSFDPNLRESLWDSLETAKEQFDYGMKYCDILKISDNEIVWFTGEEDYEKAVQILRDTYQIPLIFLTLGKEGSRAYYKDLCVEVPGFVQQNVVDTTGAGDTFFGCALHKVLAYGLEDLTKEKLQDILTFANAGASIITTRKGALRVMPTEEEILSVIHGK